MEMQGNEMNARSDPTPPEFVNELIAVDLQSLQTEPEYIQVPRSLPIGQNTWWLEHV